MAEAVLPGQGYCAAEGSTFSAGSPRLSVPRPLLPHCPRKGWLEACRQAPPTSA